MKGSVRSRTVHALIGIVLKHIPLAFGYQVVKCVAPYGISERGQVVTKVGSRIHTEALAVLYDKLTGLPRK